MDKETLSNYGWIVICVLVLAVMIALATPFGSFISGAVKSTTEGLFDVNYSALNATGLMNVGYNVMEGEYKMLDGANQVSDGSEDLVFRSEADFGEFVSVKVDGNTVASENYSVTEGSTIVTLKREYVETLSAGPHKIEIVSQNGSAICGFTIVEDGAISVWDGSVATDWYDDSKSELVINTAADLAGFGQLITGGNTFAGKTVILSANIDLANIAWAPMGNGAANTFAGTFDGRGHTIRNMTASCNYYRGVGFFRSLGDGAVIKNLTFVNANVNNGEATSSNHFYGVVAGHSKNLTLENVDVKDSTVTCKYSGAALVGCMEGATVIRGCDIKNVTLNTTNAIRVAVFGIIGNSANGHTVDIQNCTITNVTSFVDGAVNELKDVRYYSEF